MDIVVNEELKAYIDPLTPDEYAALEQSLLAEGCRDALVLWNDLLVDGHNRYAICSKHGLPFNTVQATRFKSIEDVHLWMIDQHLGRRSLSDFQRGVLALRKREIGEQRRARADTAKAAAEPAAPASEPSAEAPAAPSAASAAETREELARVARLSSTQVAQIDKIQKQAAPEVVAAVKAGDISISAAATVASLPWEEQVAAAAGGKDELKQAAKRVREAKRKPEAEAPEGAADVAPAAEDTLDSLRQRVAVLEAENQDLRAQLARLQGGA